MSYINEVILEPISINEIVPRTVTFSEIPVQASNAITAVPPRRFNLTTGDTTGTNIAANCSVPSNMNQILMTDMWLAAETVALGTRLAGKFRIRLVLTDVTGTNQQVEINLIQKVLD